MDRRSRFVGINEHLRWLGRRTFWKPLEKSIPAKVHVTSVSVQFICMGIARDGDGCSSVSILSGPAVPSACCLPLDRSNSKSRASATMKTSFLVNVRMLPSVHEKRAVSNRFSNTTRGLKKVSMGLASLLNR